VEPSAGIDTHGALDAGTVCTSSGDMVIVEPVHVSGLDPVELDELHAPSTRITAAAAAPAWIRICPLVVVKVVPNSRTPPVTASRPD
jgi:hypothetical protein